MPIVSKGNRRSIDSHLSINPNNIYPLSSFFQNEYKEFSLYVLENRCSPKLDGYRTGARKAVYSAFVGSLKNRQDEKMLTVIGDVYKLTLYPHGDSGLTGSLHSITADFYNNLPCLEVIGSNGSLRSPAAMAAPRYLSMRLSKYSFIYEYDRDLWKYKVEENKQIEPELLYPPVCTLLTTQSIGLAPGFSFKSMSYNPLDVIDAQIEFLKTGNIKTRLRPYVNGIQPDTFTYSDVSGRWTSCGKYTLNDKTQSVQITDFPYNVTFKDIGDTFNKLLDTGKIKDWKNFSHDGKTDYRVMFNPKDYNRLSTSKADLEKMLLLSQVVPQNILNVINEKNKLMYFESENDLLKYFTEWRLTIYDQRKTKLIKVMEERYEKNNEICKFIELVNSGKIVIQNRKKKDVVADLKKNDLSADVLSIEISKLTDEEKDVLFKKNEEIKNELAYIKSTDVKDMFINDLKDIRKKIKNDFE